MIRFAVIQENNEMKLILEKIFSHMYTDTSKYIFQS